MKILFVHDNAHHIGGAETHLFSLMNLLRDHQQEIFYFSIDDVLEIKNSHDFIFKDNVNSNRIINYIYHNFLNPIIYTSFRKWIKEVKPDIIHLHVSVKYPLSIIIAAYMEKIPIVQTVHDIRLLCPVGTGIKLDGNICDCGFGLKCVFSKCLTKRRFFNNFIPSKLMMFFLKNIIDCFISNSKAFDNILQRNGLKKVVNIPHFLDINEFKLGFDNPQNGNILFVGFVHENKGIEFLIQSFAKILTKIPYARLHIVGEVYDEIKIKTLINALHLDKKIVLYGKIEHNQMYKFYSKANVVVVPSICFEQFGIVGLEAMASSRPVVGSNIGGIPEWIEDGINGYLVEPRNVDQLSEKISCIILDLNLAKTMGLRGRERVEKEFTPLNHITQLLKLYNSILEDRIS